MTTHHVITNCTARKRHPIPANLRASTLSTGSRADVAANWRRRVATHIDTVPAATLYGGRSFSLATSTAATLNANLWVVSAGLGLIAGTDTVPAYSLTVAPGNDDSIMPRLKDSQTTAAWWATLTDTPPCCHTHAASLARLLTANTGLVLLAASSSYLDMVAADLLSAPSAARANLRILSWPSPSLLRSDLAPWLLPYDARLDGPVSTHRGCRSDFPQRALAHFASHVLPHTPDGTLAAHQHAVRAALATLSAPAATARRQADDAEIVILIARATAAGATSVTAALRHLRDTFHVACEDHRFRRLFSQAV